MKGRVTGLPTKVANSAASTLLSRANLAPLIVIVAVGTVEGSAGETVDGNGLALAPGFIDVHTHDDLEVIRQPAMPAKLSQGVTTVVVGNCGISASPVRPGGGAGGGSSSEFKHFYLHGWGWGSGNAAGNQR